MLHPRTLFLVLALTTAAPCMAQLPADPHALSPYPGASRIAEEEAGGIYFETVGGTDYDNPIQILDQGHLAWHVEATPEDVFRWYLQRIPSRERAEEDPSDPPRAGDGFPAFHVVTPHDLRRPGDGDVHSGAQVRAALEEVGRRPLRPDVYVQHSSFYWTVRNASGESTDFQLEVIDDGLFYTDGHRTRIDLHWTRYLAGDAAEEYVERAEERADEEHYAEASRELGSAPSVDDLGVPAYAGAQYDAQMSIAMSAGDEARSYVFFTADDPEAVRTFYEAETGVTATEIGTGAFVIALEGPAMMPDHGIMIGATAGTPYASRGPTMFMVRRSRSQ